MGGRLIVVCGLPGSGKTTLAQALALSLNTVSVRLTLEFGPIAVARTAHRLGIASKLEPNASLARGTSEVSLLELVSAYAPFANGGNAVDTHRKVPDAGVQQVARIPEVLEEVGAVQERVAVVALRRPDSIRCQTRALASDGLAVI